MKDQTGLKREAGKSNPMRNSFHLLWGEVGVVDTREQLLPQREVLQPKRTPTT